MGDIALLADNHKNLVADILGFPYMDPLGPAYSSLVMVTFDALANTRKKQKTNKIVSLAERIHDKKDKTEKASKNL